MFNKTVKITLKNIFKYKNTSLIKILSLTIGLFCISIIYTYINNEFSFDSFHNKSKQINRLLTVEKSNGEISADQPAVILEYLIDEFPEIVDGTRFLNWGRSNVKFHDQLFLERKVLLADANVFKIFNFPFIKGNPSNALKLPFSMVISESTAQKYFGNQNPIGEVLIIDNDYSFTITGVIADVPANSHIQFDFLGSFSSLEKINQKILTEWNYSFSYVYLEIEEHVNRKLLENKLHDFMKKTRGEKLASIIYLRLEHLSDIHLRSVNTRNDFAIKGNIKLVYMFSVVAILILVIACFNFTTLTLANIRQRAKEIGVRKVNGASQISIFKQFLFETLFYTSISLCLSIIITMFVLPYLNTYLGANLFLNANIIWVLLIISLILVPLFAGGYPSLLMAKLKPKMIISGDYDNQLLRQVSGKSKSISVRNSIVFLQIVFAVVVLISTILIYQQLKYIDHFELGFKKENIVVIDNPADDHMQERFKEFKQLVIANSNIENISAASDFPPYGSSRYNRIRLEGMSDDESIQMAVVEVDPDFFTTIKSPFVMGYLSSANVLLNNPEVILNQAAMKVFNLENPIGEKLVGLKSSDSFLISGVINDINFNTLHEKIEPMVFLVNSESNSTIIAKVEALNIQKTIHELKKNWEKIAPNYLFQYSFLSKNINNCYTQERKAVFLFIIFTVLAICLSVFGIIGLISFTIETSIKEMVMRKIFGAKMLSINVLFYRKIMGIVLTAILVACPIAYAFITMWLRDFNYKMAITFLPFILTSVVITALIIASISYQVFKGNKLNVIKALKQQ
jgi:putative ABC transport system permease protein